MAGMTFVALWGKSKTMVLFEVVGFALIGYLITSFTMFVNKAVFCKTKIHIDEFKKLV
jgi:hypothetical protein